MLVIVLVIRHQMVVINQKVKKYLKICCVIKNGSQKYYLYYCDPSFNGRTLNCRFKNTGPIPVGSMKALVV